MWTKPMGTLRTICIEQTTTSSFRISLNFAMQICAQKVHRNKQAYAKYMAYIYKLQLKTSIPVHFKYFNTIHTPEVPRPWEDVWGMPLGGECKRPYAQAEQPLILIYISAIVHTMYMGCTTILSEFYCMSTWKEAMIGTALQSIYMQ